MKKLLFFLRENSSLVYGFLFILILISALMSFFLAQAGSIVFLGLVLVIIILANLLVILI